MFVGAIEGFFRRIVMVSVVGRYDTMAMSAGVYRIVSPSRSLIGDFRDK